MMKPEAMQLLGKELLTSQPAMLAAGSLKHGDIVYAKTEPIIVGEIERFWEWEGDIFVAVKAYARVHADHRYWSCCGADSRVISASLVVDAVMWRVHTPTPIRIIPPFVV